jgi:hypothetical protein
MTQPISHAEQRHLYDTNRPAWITFAAPAIAKRMREVCKAEKDRMWAACPPELRKELRKYA